MAGGAGPPVVVISSSKELSGAAWNLKERLGVTELLAADATESQTLETLAVALPALRHPGSQLESSPGAGVAHERWVGDTTDRYTADVARRFNVGLVLVSVVLGEQEWFRVHVNLPRRALGPGRSPRDWSFVRQVLEVPQAIVVPDVQQHPVFAQVDSRRPALRGCGNSDGRLGRTRQRRDGLFDLEAAGARCARARCARRIGNRLAELDGGIERADSQERFSALSRLALTDQVTGLANRRGGEEALVREVSRARRTGAPLSLVLFDIDRFKRVNDQAGHAVGDRVLKGISGILSQSQRGSDLAMRWGGEEFLVLLPDVGLTGARIFAERVRENVQNLVVPEAGRITVRPASQSSRRRRSCRRARPSRRELYRAAPAYATASKSIRRR